jgi:hypothetical protein
MIVLQVNDSGRKTESFSVEVDYLFTNMLTNGEIVYARLSSGYAATIDYFQGHEVITNKKDF